MSEDTKIPILTYSAQHVDQRHACQNEQAPLEWNLKPERSRREYQQKLSKRDDRIWDYIAQNEPSVE